MGTSRRTTRADWDREDAGEGALDGAGAPEVRMRELRLRQRGASAPHNETPQPRVPTLATPARPVGRDLPWLVAMAFRATRLLRMRIDGSHQGNQMFGAPVSKTAYLDGSGPTFSAKKYVQPAPVRKLRPRSMPRYSLCAQGQ